MFFLESSISTVNPQVIILVERMFYYIKSKGIRWGESICKPSGTENMPSNTKQHQHLKCKEKKT